MRYVRRACIPSRSKKVVLVCRLDYLFFFSRTLPCLGMTSSRPLSCFSRTMWQSGDPCEVACDGCQTTCDGCSFEEPALVPMCTAVMEHAFSDGGTDTLEMLSIERGYWRATPSSEDVLACYNTDACLGGVTGAAGNCLEGYEGPCTCLSHTPAVERVPLTLQSVPAFVMCAKTGVPPANTDFPACVFAHQKGFGEIKLPKWPKRFSRVWGHDVGIRFTGARNSKPAKNPMPGPAYVPMLTQWQLPLQNDNARQSQPEHMHHDRVHSCVADCEQTAPSVVMGLLKG